MSPPDAGWNRIRTQLGRVTAALETSESLPPACYTDPAVLAREYEHIFRTSWVGVGRADRWQAPGDYAALSVGGVPVIVIRGKNGELGAFANSCRHRGTQLLVGEGSCRRIQCPFHSWTYALDGRLIGAPRMDRAQGFEMADYGLVAFRAAVVDGFAFVCLDETVPGLEDWLGDFSHRHAPWQLGAMVATRRREFDVGCNWKMLLEVFNEYYHLPYVHPASFGGIYEEPDAPFAIRGNYTAQFGTTQGTGGLTKDTQDQALPTIAGLEGRNRRGTLYSWMFPNMTFAAGSEAIWVYEAHPIAPDRTRTALTVCFPAETVARADFEERAQHYYGRFDTALAEDIAILERQQAGLTSPYARPGRFADLEPSVATFAHWYAGKMLAP